MFEKIRRLHTKDLPPAVLQASRRRPTFTTEATSKEARVQVLILDTSYTLPHLLSAQLTFQPLLLQPALCTVT